MYMNKKIIIAIIGVILIGVGVWYFLFYNKNTETEVNEIIPEEPNSYKFESFIFDAFEFFDNIAILRGKREDDFAPVKNKDGVDSPKTAKELYEKFWNK